MTYIHRSGLFKPLEVSYEIFTEWYKDWPMTGKLIPVQKNQKAIKQETVHFPYSPFTNLQFNVDLL